VSPILVRPVREQLEHDRVIRLLQQRWRRKYLVGINQGSETTTSVVYGETTYYPDVVLSPTGKPNKPEIVVEVETGESVNHLEALAQWARLAQLKAAFHLYVPSGAVGPARRLCTAHNIPVAEIWSYHLVGDEMRFTMVYKAPKPTRAARRPTAETVAARTAARPAASRPAAANGSARKAAPGRRPAAAKAVSRKPAAAKRGAAKRVAAKRVPPKKAAAKPARATKRR